MDTILIIGIAGAVCILLAFLLNELDVIEEETYAFQGLNLLGSTLLVGNAFVTGAIPFLILNSVWALVSLWRLMKLIFVR